MPAGRGGQAPASRRTASTTAPTMTGRGRWRSWRSRGRSRRGRGRSGRCCSSGTPARRAGCSGSRYNADYPVVPLERSSPSSTWTWSAATATTIRSRRTRSRRRLGPHQHRAAQHQRGRERVAAEAADARLRDERSGGHRVDLHAQRSLQLRVEGHSDRLLLHRPAPRLPPAERHVDKIVFDKIQRVAQLAYETGRRVGEPRSRPGRATTRDRGRGRRDREDQGA